MARNFSVFIFLLCVLNGQRFVESGVTHGRDKGALLSDWKDKLSHVLDTESEELAILHNLIENGVRDDEEIDSISTKTKSPSNPRTGDKSSILKTDSVEYLRENGIISKLEENSKRMDGMVEFLADLKNVLSDAITVQDKQMRFETEVVELREEIDYLR